MKKKAMKRRIRHLEQRLYQELPQLQLENDLLRYSKTGSVSSWVTEALGGHHPGPSIEYVTRPENIARGGYPGYYPDPQVPDQEC